MSELKPCPFCGSSCVNNAIDPAADKHGAYAWTCPNCICSGAIGRTVEGATDGWNSRYDNQRQDGWISVEDRTPNYKESTQLDVFISGEVERAYWEPSHKEFAFTYGMVTHWRPKPQPPTTSTLPTHVDD